MSDLSRVKQDNSLQITSETPASSGLQRSQHEDSQPDRGTAARAVHCLLLRRLTFWNGFSAT